MTRMLPCLISILVIAVGIAQAVPVRPLYEPVSPVTPPPVLVNLNGSAWAGKYMAANRTYIFEPDGTLSYSTGDR